MASSSPSSSTWRSSWKTTTINDSFPTTALTLSSASSSSPTIFNFSLTKRNTITKFSLHDNNNNSNNQRKSIYVDKSMESDSLVSKDEVILKSGSLIEKSEIRLSRKQRSSRPLWRRILFASKKVRSIILLNVLALVYASNIPVLKEIEAVSDPAVFTAVRFSIATIPFLPFVLRARGDVQTRSAGIELGVWVSLGYLMQALGLTTSDAGRASFISCFTVVIVPLIDGILGTRVPALTWFGAVISILGVAMLESSGSPPCIGDFWNILGAVFFGIHMLRTEHVSRNTKKENFLALLGYEVCVVAIFSTIWYLGNGWFISNQEWDPGSWTWALARDWIVEFPWVPALYTGIFSTTLCLWVELAAMRDVSATETAIIYGLEPLWGAGFAWFLLGERWGIIGWIGAALVLSGSLTVQLFGSLSAEGRSNEQGDQLLVSKKRNALSALPIAASSKKYVQDMFNKK